VEETPHADDAQGETRRLILCMHPKSGTVRDTMTQQMVQLGGDNNSGELQRLC